jgi:1-acyl-sn-glycerol-3-phosphate acyltransferase
MKIILNKFLGILQFIITWLIVILSFLIGTTIILIFALFNKDKEKVFHKGARIWSRFLLWIARIKVTIIGTENINSGPVIFASNHQGMLDILVLLAYLPVKFSFIIKEELFKIPLFGWYLRKSGYISIDRKKSFLAHHALENAEKLLKENKGNILIFPEGTRSKTGELQAFKRGSLLIALQTLVPIIPIAIKGSFNLMPPGSKTVRSGTISLKIGSPLLIEEEKTNNKEIYQQKMLLLHNKIAQMLKD